MPENGTSEIPADLSPVERQVLKLLTEHGEPLDAVGIASLCLLDVEVVVKTLQSLQHRDLVAAYPPEPVHERFASAAHA